MALRYEPFSSCAFEGEDGLGERGDAVGAAAGAVEDDPVSEGDEAAFAGAADAGAFGVGVEVVLGQVFTSFIWVSTSSVMRW